MMPMKSINSVGEYRVHYSKLSDNLKVRRRVCRLPWSSRGKRLVKRPTGNHGAVHSKQEFDAKSSYPVEARIQQVTE